MILKLNCIVFFIFIFSAIDSYSQSDTLFYYDVTNVAFSKNDIEKGKFESRLSLFYDELANKWNDSISISIIFTDGKGGMFFEKKVNGQTFLSGQYKFSENYQVKDITHEDPLTGEKYIEKNVVTFYPIRTGLWKIYFNGKVIDIISFE